MKRYGVYCSMYGKDCFMETEQTKRTAKLAQEFINKVQNKMNKFYNIEEKDIGYVKIAMRPATFEVKAIQKGDFAGLSYYEINGDNFSYGCDACKNPMENCILV